MGTGGSRLGAGRPSQRMKAEYFLRLDVRRWHRNGVLSSGYSGAWEWRDHETGQTRGSISYTVGAGTVSLRFSSGGVPVCQSIVLTQTGCTFGGARPWFVCPVRGERVAVLFFRSGRFACRTCQRLCYASQSEDACGRAWRKQAKVERKLGPDWARPKGMHKKTHERLIEIILDCEERRDAALAGYITALLHGRRQLS